MIIELVRHGESAANAGEATEDPASIPLTAEGWRQAERIAGKWSESPALIVCSPFLRARQTGEPTRARFPDARTEEWPVQEFTFLETTRCAGTTQAQRMPWVAQYWQNADPAFRDGPGAESFSMLLRRVEATLQRLAASREGPVVIFTHQQWIQALRLTVAEPLLDDGEKMRMFPDGLRAHPVANGGVVSVEVRGGRLIFLDEGEQQEDP